MGKRQMRISNSELPSKLISLIGSEAAVILKNDKTILGKILNFADSQIIIRDNFLTKHMLDIKLIEEVITDQVTSY